MRERRAIAHIRGQAQGLAPLCFNGGSGLVHLLLAAGRGHHIRAGIGQAQAQRQPDARGSTNYNGDFTFKTENLIAHLHLHSGYAQSRQGRLRINNILCFASQEDRGDVPVEKVLRHVLRDYRFIRFEQIQIAALHLGRHLESNMQQLPQAAVIGWV